MLTTSLSIISTILLFYVMLYFVMKINKNRSIFSLSVKEHLCVILLGLILAILHYKVEGLIMLIINILLYVIVTKYIVKITTNEAVASTFATYLIIAITDILGVIIYTILNVDLVSLTTIERTLIGNVLIIFLMLLVTVINPLMDMIYKFVKKSGSKIGNIIITSILFIGTIYIMVYYNIKSSDLEDIIIKFLTAGILIFTLIKFFIEKNSKNNIVKEFEKMNEYVKIYEEIIEKDRITRHENKNQLITIKGMISKKDKKTNEYIDSLISDNNDMSNKWVSELKNIPIGGLKGLLFYKVNKMRSSGIEVDLTISRSLEGSKLQDIDTKLYKQLCQVIGVYVDNAIEACMEADIKNIGIEIYKDGDIFEFIISNTYKGNLNIDSIDSAGYTTKGDGHGYGLSLVRDIINSNPKFFQNREMINDYYIQHLFLDLTE